MYYIIANICYIIAHIAHYSTLCFVRLFQLLVIYVKIAEEWHDICIGNSCAMYLKSFNKWLIVYTIYLKW